MLASSELRWVYIVGDSSRGLITYAEVVARTEPVIRNSEELVVDQTVVY